MIDLHCHILPGVDDGPDSLDTAVTMAKIAIDDGIFKVVATPHLSHNPLSSAELKRQVANLNSHLMALGIPLEVEFGAEVNFQMSPDMLSDFTLNNSSYLLVEFPHSHLPANFGQILFNLRVRGLIPIIAHPERNPTIMNDPAGFLELLDDDVYLQITAASITGKFGGEVKKCASYFLEKGRVHFLASDGHSSTWRRPILSKGVKEASKIIGVSHAKKLVTDNPAAVLAGVSLT